MITDGREVRMLVGDWNSVQPEFSLPARIASHLIDVDTFANKG